MSRHQNHVVTPISPNSVATSKWCRDITSTHSGSFRSRHQKLLRDTPTAPICRDTKDFVVTDLSSHAAFMSRRQRPCRDTPNGYPRLDLKIKSQPRTCLVPSQPCRDTKIEVATWGQGKPVSRSCTSSLSWHHLLCHDLRLEMGSSPSVWSLAALFFFVQNPLVAFLPLLYSYSLYKTCYS